MASDVFAQLKEALLNLAEAAGVVAKNLCDLCDMFRESPELMKAAEIINLPHCKIKHLALYSNKKRVRKKNLKRLLKMKG